MTKQLSAKYKQSGRNPWGRTAGYCGMRGLQWLGTTMPWLIERTNYSSRMRTRTSWLPQNSL